MCKSNGTAPRKRKETQFAMPPQTRSTRTWRQVLIHLGCVRVVCIVIFIHSSRLRKSAYFSVGGIAADRP